MSKLRYAALIISGILIIPFFIYKFCLLQDFHKYPGKVIKTEEVNVYQKRWKVRGYYAKRTLPVIQYFTAKDTFEFTEGKYSLFSFDVGDRVTVLEKKDNSYKVTVFSFWLYWVNMQEVILFLLISGVVFGFYLKFIYKEKS